MISSSPSLRIGVLEACADVFRLEVWIVISNPAGSTLHGADLCGVGRRRWRGWPRGCNTRGEPIADSDCGLRIDWDDRTGESLDRRRAFLEGVISAARIILVHVPSPA